MRGKGPAPHQCEVMETESTVVINEGKKREERTEGGRNKGKEAQRRSVFYFSGGGRHSR